jgi:hypothetical protein
MRSLRTAGSTHAPIELGFLPLVEPFPALPRVVVPPFGFSRFHLPTSLGSTVITPLPYVDAHRTCAAAGTYNGKGIPERDRSVGLPSIVVVTVIGRAWP